MTEAEPTIEQWDDRSLFEHLLAQGKDGTRGLEFFSKLPQTIELGAIQTRVDQLREYTRNTNNEHGLGITYDPVSGKILLDKDYIEGKPGSSPIDVSYTVTSKAEQLISTLDVSLQTRIRDGFSKLEQSSHPAGVLFDPTNPQAQLLRQYARRPIGTIHSHPNEVPFSVGDVAHFLHELGASHTSFYVLSRPSGITEVLLMCRETDTLDAETAQQNYQRWDRAIEKRMEEVMGTTMSPDRAQVFTRINEAMLKTLAKKYQFGWYQNTVEQPTQLKRVNT